MSFEQNIDWQEISKFSSEQLDWWNPKGKVWTLHAINPLRLDYITNHANVIGKKILDLGCGAGILAESLAQEGAIVTGIDLNQTAIQAGCAHLELTKLTHPNLQVDYQLISSEKLAQQQPQNYDIIVCMEMLEHVPNPHQIIVDCAQLLKPKGHVFFSTLNRNWQSYLSAIIAAEYVLKILPKHTHDFAKFIKPYELYQWATQSGIKLHDLTGINYNLLTKKFSLTNKVTVNYLAHGTLIA